MASATEEKDAAALKQSKETDAATLETTTLEHCEIHIRVYLESGNLNTELVRQLKNYENRGMQMKQKYKE